MKLLRLKATDFRNLASVNLELSERFNLITGLNGSGKTSLLEAIYFLSLGRSFRTNLNSRIINYDSESFSIFGHIEDENGISVSTGIEKNRQGKVRIKVGNETSPSQAELAKALPVQLINPDSYSLLTEGPRARREFMDWGVFHVEHSFFPTWQRFQRALKQRNSSLQQAMAINQIKAWDEEISILGQELAELRSRYIQKLTPLFFNILEQLIDLKELSLVYYRGWEAEQSLKEALELNFPRDRALGYTQLGPQRADLIIKIQETPVQDVLSRGEQKLLVLALRLAQGALLRELINKSCVYLLDDIAAELDKDRQKQVIVFLTKLQAQVFATAVDQNILKDLKDLHGQPTRMFHVEQGKINN